MKRYPVQEMCRNEEKVKNKVRSYFIVLGGMFVVSFVLLLLLSFFVWKMDGAGNVLCAGILGVYIVTNVFGGFWVGRMMGQQKFFWGAATGGSYFLILLAAGVCLADAKLFGNTQLMTAALLCIISGMFGGMLAPASLSKDKT